MPQRVYLDSQCTSYLLAKPVFNQGWTAEGTAAFRSAVEERLTGGTIAILGSQFHLEEASRIPDVEHRSRYVQYFWHLVKWHFLIPPFSLVRDEARLARPLEGNELFEDFAQRQLIRALSFSAKKLDGLAVDVKAFKIRVTAESVASIQSAQAQIAIRFPGLSASAVTRKWWTDIEPTIESWVKAYMADSRAFLGLSENEAEWPDARGLQTAWAMHSFLMARVARTLGEGRRVDDGDVYDALHFATACYADVVVTEDREFRATVAMIPNSLPTLLTFREFASQFGIAPH